MKPVFMAVVLVATGSAAFGSEPAAPPAVGVGIETSSQPAGAKVTSVMLNGPAAKAGIKVGDVITTVGGAGVDSGTGFQAAVRARKVGDKVDLVVVRDGTARTLGVTLFALTRQAVRDDLRLKTTRMELMIAQREAEETALATDLPRAELAYYRALQETAGTVPTAMRLANVRTRLICVRSELEVLRRWLQDTRRQLAQLDDE